METQEREIRSGKYKFTIDRECVCGHRLGVHSAERIRIEGKPFQDCMNHDVGDGNNCDCKCFAPIRK